MSTVSIAEFREAFPTFTAERFPDSAVQFRLDLAESFIDAKLIGDETVWSHMVKLYVAHYLAVAGSAASGGVGTDTGAGMGVVASKSVDGASISYDVSSTAIADAGLWNATIFGRELLSLLRLFGAGAIQL